MIIFRLKQCVLRYVRPKILAAVYPNRTYVINKKRRRARRFFSRVYALQRKYLRVREINKMVERIDETEDVVLERLRSLVQVTSKLAFAVRASSLSPAELDNLDLLSRDVVSFLAGELLCRLCNELRAMVWLVRQDISSITTSNTENTTTIYYPFRVLRTRNATRNSNRELHQPLHNLDVLRCRVRSGGTLRGDNGKSWNKA